MKTVPVFLLVEPSPILRPVLSRWLEDVLTHAHFLVATNDEEALGLAAIEEPSYVLVAINVPAQRDFELLSQLRQTLPNARIIATSWLESRWSLDRIRWTGTDGFMTKDKLRSELLPLWGISTA